MRLYPIFIFDCHANNIGQYLHTETDQVGIVAGARIDIDKVRRALRTPAVHKNALSIRYRSR